MAARTRKIIYFSSFVNEIVYFIICNLHSINRAILNSNYVTLKITPSKTIKNPFENGGMTHWFEHSRVSEPRWVLIKIIHY